MPELKKISPQMAASVSVIPCCADFDHFVPQTEPERILNRAKIGIPENAVLVSYLGSLGTWYMVEEMVSFFALLARSNKCVQMLLITRDWNGGHDALIQSMRLDDIRDRIHIHPATRETVPELLGISDVMLSFIKPAYSKIASSPTKLAEAFSMGIPVISNSGVGDVDQIIEELDAGAIVDLSDDSNIAQTASNLKLIVGKGGVELRERARKRFGLEVASRLYEDVYHKLEHSK
jgi:glycosyltransferase involved in cell wall biosynthesis